LQVHLKFNMNIHHQHHVTSQLVASHHVRCKDSDVLSDSRTQLGVARPTLWGWLCHCRPTTSLLVLRLRLLRRERLFVQGGREGSRWPHPQGRLQCSPSPHGGSTTVEWRVGFRAGMSTCATTSVEAGGHPWLPLRDVVIGWQVVIIREGWGVVSPSELLPPSVGVATKEKWSCIQAESSAPERGRGVPTGEEEEEVTEAAVAISVGGPLRVWWGSMPLTLEPLRMRWPPAPSGC
jgi:hypothetical protein